MAILPNIGFFLVKAGSTGALIRSLNIKSTPPSLSSFLLLVFPFQLMFVLTGHPCLLTSYTHRLANVALESPANLFSPLIQVIPFKPAYLPVRRYQQFLDATSVTKLSPKITHLP